VMVLGVLGHSASLVIKASEGSVLNQLSCVTDITRYLNRHRPLNLLHLSNRRQEAH
jgi:hypothetical protein